MSQSNPSKAIEKGRQELKEVAPGITGQWIDWGAAVEGSARELLRDGEDDGPTSPQLDAAKAWLKERTPESGTRVVDLVQSAAEAGHAWITVKRAKRALGVRSANHGRNGSLWLLPPSPAAEKNT